MLPTGILYIAHGSRVASNNQKILSFTANITAALSANTATRTAFLEGDERTIIRSIHHLYEQGVRKLIVVPLLLFTAVHASEDIPREIKLACCYFPDIEVKILTPLAEMGVLTARLKQIIKCTQTDNIAGIDLIAHGSFKYPAIEQTLQQMCISMGKTTQFKIDYAVLYGQKYYLTLLKKQASSKKHYLVIPLFLMDGQIVQKLSQTIQTHFPNGHFHITSSLALDPKIGARLAAEIRKEQRKWAI